MLKSNQHIFLEWGNYMRFVTYKLGKEIKIGITNEQITEIIDLEKLYASKGTKMVPAKSMIEVIELGENFINEVKDLLEWEGNQKNKSWIVSIGSGEVELLAPIPKTPKNIFCLGKNYADHAIEMGSAADIPEYPMVFTKASTAINGPYSDVLSHAELTEELDYEGELAIVIGKRGSKIKKEEAFDYVFGYTIINDITARDLQKRHKQFVLGKSLDTACPMGPYISYKSLINDPNHLHIETRVNGEIRQSSTTEQFIFDIPTMLATISNGTTLEPGDVIATGTPVGVGKGFNPPRFLKPGDLVEVHIESLGWLRNKIID